jgi:tRNA pseudouridine55 synthase
MANFNGVLVVNKQSGYTSRDIVNALCKKFNTKKIGHTGTLDPMATGVLVVCIGNGLKICELLTNHDKEYIAKVILGVDTDMLDITGKVLHKENVYIEENKIRECVSSFKGDYLQEVPIYSSVKVNGRKLYDYARNKQKVELPKRMVSIKDIEIVSDIEYINGKIEFYIKTCVSKGTYIRSLIRDIAAKMGTYGIMGSLERIRQGNFTIDKSYSLEDIENGKYQILSISDSLSDIPRINVSSDILRKIKNGMRLNKFFNSEYAIIMDNDKEVAIYKDEGHLSIPYRIF